MSRTRATAISYTTDLCGTYTHAYATHAHTCSGQLLHVHSILQILDGLAMRINHQYKLFMDRHPDYIENGGVFSVAAHSLGSVIIYDIMSLHKTGGRGYSSCSQATHFFNRC